MRRSEKWKESLRPEIYGKKLEAALEERFRRIDEFFTSFDEAYEHVKRILDKYAVNPNERALYRAFAERVFSAKRRFTGKTYELITQTYAMQYLYMGAQKEILLEILELFGITFTLETPEEAYQRGYRDGYWQAYVDFSHEVDALPAVLVDLAADQFASHNAQFVKAVLLTITHDELIVEGKSYVVGELESTSQEIVSHEAGYSLE